MKQILFTLINIMIAPRELKFAPLLACCLALLTACTSTPEVKPLPPLLFPPPPEKPRFIFERTVLSSGDVEVADSSKKWRQILTGESDRAKGLAKPFDVAACQGRVYVSDSVKRIVMVFDVPTRKFHEIGREEPGMLRKPLGLAVDGECDLYVVDATLKRIMIYNQGGTFLRAIGGPDFFERPSHVAVDKDGKRVYAVDTGGVNTNNHRIRVFEGLTGQHLYDIGTRGKDNGQLNLPRDAQIGPDGLLYVVDGGNFRVQVFTQDGEFVRAWGSPGRQYGQFSRPKGIAVDKSGNIYVSDAAFGNFQIFDPTGSLLLFIGDRSEKPARAKYMLPAGITVDEDGRVYMVDQFFRKLDIYRPAEMAETDGFLGAWNRTQ